MRIAMVVPGGIGADGVHEVIPAFLSLVERLARSHEVLVIGLDQAAQPGRYRLHGAEMLALGRRARDPVGRARAWARGIDALRSFRPDVLHAIFLGPGSSMALAAGAWLRVPVVVSIGGGELVARARIRYGGLRSGRGRFHARLALARAAAVTAGSRTALGPVASRRPDVRWLPLGAERRAGEPADASTGARGPIRLLVVAGINRVKGPEVILGAVARARRRLDDRLTLDWIGEDTLDGRATDLARALGVDDLVTFHGFRPHARVLDAFEAADLLVQGSHHESQGVAVVEAAMAGVPTVGTRVGLVAELATLDPPAALAVPPGRAAALGDAIVELATDAERRRRIGMAARRWAMAHDADWTAASFEAIYRDVTSG